jgi:dTDP-4-dehydrorhamnose reductase
VHNGCTREEQLRWAAEAWDTALALRQKGVEVEAVTAWSLLGSHGWNTLLTAPGVYETGVFDVSTGAPRETALASLWRGLPAGAERHPIAQAPGWWRRPQRLVYQPFEHDTAPCEAKEDASAPLLICGATGALGQAIARACEARGIRYLVTGRDTLDIERFDSISSTLEQIQPWAVINATGWVRVDAAETAEDACHRVNASGAIALARACAAHGIGCVSFSSNLVFDGAASVPYIESDRPRPLNAYGRSKAAMEARCAGLPGALIVRTAALFSAHSPENFAAAVADRLALGRRFAAADDHIVTPTFLPALADAALDLLIDGVEGIWHLSGDEAVSWAEFACRIARACGHDPNLVRPGPGASMGWQAARPRYAALGSERGTIAASLTSGIERFAHERATMHRARVQASSGPQLRGGIAG